MESSSFFPNMRALSLFAALAVAFQLQCIDSFVLQPHTSFIKRSTIHGDDVVSQKQQQQQKNRLLFAGGFEWEDPGEALDQGVDNPFKNTELINKSGESDDGLKTASARLLGPRLNGSNLYMIGMMGSGKSAVGDIVARRMGTYNFLDTDEIIERATNVSIPEIFKQEGEDGFRDIESQVLNSVHPYLRCVISTGGGIVCRRENWSKLHTGIVVWLDCPPKVIMKRIEGTDRPLLQTENPLQTLEDLLEERREKYKQADVRIEIMEDMDPDQVADTIMRVLHDFIDENPPAWKLAKAKAQAEGIDWVQ
mmetsp:Transcript_2950/g.3957  ORF Transcript_2950/g.3957 Transcript_2950/m.3957 type:complete len:308 (+) Transcript_2950:126-1049(+)|eukprot:CAMPEP_0198144686 /NCGR_PEP_ID=MMETSP1443-20131203/17798_1 /TAXON_ID=186043 /ORGANISM="Entomoneis sp., Strain CCMP2396" /LENGTH=307 /DNA_ID=CAMNT_0043808133 /DNA_START=40 /DNA_END=963 /DNA_ORIENTATION=+